MNKDHERTATLEELEGDVWPEPPTDSTGLVKAVHRLRRVPLGELTPYELGRLIGQDTGLPWTLPLALEILRETAASQNEGGFYDDDLLSAALTRRPETWVAHPELAGELREILHLLTGLSPYIEHDRARFLQASQGVD
ncbi:contact-dependent growth inhibition system immunity protein [Streptomyces virginiae]|uniref:contact-dependent growth inhibition system immunity protein n=1 Tax=Streptomyces virginiae TaxID=1961 RepID=UPI00369F5497